MLVVTVYGCWSQDSRNKVKINAGPFERNRVRSYQNFIEYHISKGDTTFYLQNLETGEVYMSWFIPVGVGYPMENELPDGFRLSRAIELISRTVNLNTDDYIFILHDNHHRTWIRIH
jgi:hypothetical protein